MSRSAVREPDAGVMSRDDFRAALADLRLTQNNCARLLGTDERTIRHWVSGSRPVPELVRRVMLLCLENRRTFLALQRLGPGLSTRKWTNQREIDQSQQIGVD